MAAEFVIRQLESPSRILRLSGGAKPLQGFNRLGIRQRGSVRRHPGSRVGTAMLQGPEDLPTDFRFHWTPQTILRSVRVGDVFVTDVERLLDTLEKMVADSVLVSVESAGRTGIGFISEATAPDDRPGFYDVEIEIQWVKREEVLPAGIGSLTIQGSAGDALRDLHRSWIQGIQTISRPAIVAEDTIADAAESVRGINRELNRIASVQRAWAGMLDTGPAAALQGPTLAGQIAASMADVMSRALVLRTAISISGGVLAPTDEASARIAGIAMRGGIASLAGDMRHRALHARLQALTEARDDIKGKHTAVDGEDLRLVAWSHYGDASRWAAVATFNDLTSSTLRAGQVVWLPVLGGAR